MSGAYDGQTGASVFSPNDGQIHPDLFCSSSRLDLLCAVVREYGQGVPTDVSPHLISNTPSQLTRLHGSREKLRRVPHVQIHWAYIHAHGVCPSDSCSGSRLGSTDLGAILHQKTSLYLITRIEISHFHTS